MDNNEINNNKSQYITKLDVTKKANKSSVKIGDSFSYVINVTNSGDINITDIIIIDMLPNQILLQSINVDGIDIKGDLETGVNIGELKEGQSRGITLLVKSLSDLDYSFNNEVLVKGRAIINQDEGPIDVEASGKDISGVAIYNPSMVLEKSSSSEYAVVGDEIEYCIIATNNGDIELKDVIISDKLSSELDFTEGSIVVDGVSFIDDVITSGINVGNINIGYSKSIRFRAKILSNKKSKIVNQSIVDYEFSLPNSFIQSGSSISNEVVVNVEKANIKVVKQSSRESASLGDEIVYSVKLVNDGTIDAMNVIFIDNLPKALKILNGSFKVDGKIINSIDLSKGVNIGGIKRGETRLIKYTAEVISGICNGNIINEAKVRFKYVLENGVISSAESVIDSYSSSCVTINISTFKQISVDEYLRIPQEKPDIECINNITAEVDIVGSHVIITPNDRSNESQRLSGYKLIIHGILDQIIEYTALVPEQSVHSAHYKVPFSTFIILPETFSVGSKIEVEGIVEDIYYKVNDCRTFFKNVTVLLVAKILECSK